MRPATSRLADGPQNLADAVAVATAPGARGVVVVVAGTVHSALDVRKVHPYRLDAFGSGDAGPIARVEEGRAALVQRPGRTAKRPRSASIACRATRRRGRGSPIVTSGAGADARAVRALVDAGCAGIVVAATGNGTRPRRARGAAARGDGARLRRPAQHALPRRHRDRRRRSVRTRHPVGRRAHAAAGARRADRSPARARGGGAAERAAAGAQTTSRATSMLPRVAFEYGHTWCAASTSFLRRRLVHAGDLDVQRDLDAEALRDRADADVGGDRGVGGQGDLLLHGDELHRADEARRIAGREQLLGVGAGGAVAAEALGRRQLDVEDAVVGLRRAVAPAGRGGVRGVEDLLGLHRGLLVVEGGSADRFCDVVELRAELEPARLELPRSARAIAFRRRPVSARLLGVERVVGARRLQRVALGEEDAELVVDEVELLLQRLGGVGALLARGGRGLAVVARACRRRRGAAAARRAAARGLAAALARSRRARRRRLRPRRARRRLRLLEQPALVVVEVAVERLDAAAA